MPEVIDSLIIGIFFQALAHARKSGIKQNVCCVSNPMSGFPSAIATFMKRQTPLFKLPGSRSAAARVASNYTALVRMTARTGVGERLHALSFRSTPGEAQALSRGRLINKQTVQNPNTIKPRQQHPPGDGHSTVRQRITHLQAAPLRHTEIWLACMQVHLSA